VSRVSAMAVSSSIGSRQSNETQERNGNLESAVSGPLHIAPPAAEAQIKAKGGQPQET